MEGFKGIFVDSKVSFFIGKKYNFQGYTIDYRDKTNCPCFSMLKKKDVGHQVQLLTMALENQINDLKICDNPDAVLEDDLVKLLEKVKKGYSQYVKKKDSSG